jgi:hypothetical protein
MQNEILDLVKESILALNQFRDESDQLIFSQDLVLFGQGSKIDSLDLVSVITEIEENLSDNFDLDISLTDDRALSRVPSPYDSVKLLIEFVSELVEEAR